MTPSSWCLDCDPIPCAHGAWHVRLAQFFDVIASRVFIFDRIFVRYPRAHAAFSKALAYAIIRSLLRLGILRLCAIARNDPRVYRRTMVVVEEARTRGIDIFLLTFCGKPTNLFSLHTRPSQVVSSGVYSRRDYFFEGLPHLEVGSLLPLDVDDKALLKKVLACNGFPVPRGNICQKYSEAASFIAQREYPVVIKPVSGSLSRHTFCPVENEHQLREAVHRVKKICTSFLVEEYIPGDVFRITVVDGRVIATCRREPPNVIGDGVHTIQELMERKNTLHERGSFFQKNTTLHHLPKTPHAYARLQESGLSLESVLPASVKYILHPKVTLGCGADIHDATGTLHPDTKEMFERAAQLCRLPVIGFDFICSDSTASFHGQKCGILEANSMPYIDMHHSPVTGKPRDVAGAILEWFGKSMQRV